MDDADRPGEKGGRSSPFPWLFYLSDPARLEDQPIYFCSSATEPGQPTVDALRSNLSLYAAVVAGACIRFDYGVRVLTCLTCIKLR